MLTIQHVHSSRTQMCARLGCAVLPMAFCPFSGGTGASAPPAGCVATSDARGKDTMNRVPCPRRLSTYHDRQCEKGLRYVLSRDTLPRDKNVYPMPSCGTGHRG